jgi:hypothetical protein
MLRFNILDNHGNYEKGDFGRSKLMIKLTENHVNFVMILTSTILLGEVLYKWLYLGLPIGIPEIIILGIAIILGVIGINCNKEKNK